MSLLSPVNQSRLEETFIQDGYFSATEFSSLKLEAEKAKTPILAYLINKQKISEEAVTKILAKIINYPM